MRRYVHGPLQKKPAFGVVSVSYKAVELPSGLRSQER